MWIPVPFNFIGYAVISNDLEAHVTYTDHNFSRIFIEYCNLANECWILITSLDLKYSITYDGETKVFLTGSRLVLHSPPPPDQDQSLILEGRVRERTHQRIQSRHWFSQIHADHNPIKGFTIPLDSGRYHKTVRKWPLSIYVDWGGLLVLHAEWWNSRMHRTKSFPFRNKNRVHINGEKREKKWLGSQESQSRPTDADQRDDATGDKIQ